MFWLDGGRALKTVINKTRRPLRIRLGGGKTLHLGPMKSGKVADQAAEEESLRKLVEAGDVEILGEGGSTPSGDAREGATHDTHGHPPTTVVLPKGNR